MNKYQTILLAFMTLTLCLLWPQRGFAQDERDTELNQDQDNNAETVPPAEDGGESEAADADATPDKSDAEPASSDSDTDGGEAEAGDASAEEGESLGFQRSGRMEFDERLVKGQAAKSGAVYLFKRTPRRLPGLVPFRRSYRTRIVQPVLGKRELKTPTYSTEVAEKEGAEDGDNTVSDKKTSTDTGDEAVAKDDEAGEGVKDGKNENGKAKGKKKKNKKSKKRKRNGKHRRKTGGTK